MKTENPILDILKNWLSTKNKNLDLLDNLIKNTEHTLVDKNQEIIKLLSKEELSKIGNILSEDNPYSLFKTVYEECPYNNTEEEVKKEAPEVDYEWVDVRSTEVEDIVLPDDTLLESVKDKIRYYKDQIKNFEETVIKLEEFQDNYNEFKVSYRDILDIL